MSPVKCFCLLLIYFYTIYFHTTCADVHQIRISINVGIDYIILYYIILYYIILYYIILYYIILYYIILYYIILYYIILAK